MYALSFFCVVFSSAAPASFSMNQRRGTLMFVLFHPSGCLLFFVVLCGVSFAYSVFGLLSSVPPVSCACFPAPVVLVVISCLSDCRLALFRFSLSSGKVRLLFQLSCLSLVVVLCSPVSFFSLWVRLFSFVLPPLALFCVSPLCCLSIRLS